MLNFAYLSICQSVCEYIYTLKSTRKDSYIIPTMFKYFSIFDSFHFVTFQMIVDL